LRVAAFADAEQRRGALYDSEFPLFHDCSLAHLTGVNACEYQTAPLPGAALA
jgi:hypothetical protein